MRKNSLWYVLFFFVLVMVLVQYCFEKSAFSQEPKKEERVVGLLKSWIWNGEDSSISWVVSESKISKEGKSLAMTEKKYRVNIQEATMTVDGKTRNINSYESLLVRRNLEIIALYLIDCVDWWYRLEGKKVKANGVA